MAVGTAMAISAGAGLLGSYFSAKSKQRSQRRANQQNIKLARENRKFQKREAERNRGFQAMEAATNRRFQEKMSNTAYTRATKDMKRAGLNPMLAHVQGGASTPTGGQASGAQAAGDRAQVQPEDPEARQLVEGLVSGALQAKRLKEDIEVMEENKKNLKKQRKKIEQETKEAKARTKRTKAEAEIKEGEVPIAQAKEGVTESIIDAVKGAFNPQTSAQQQSKSRFRQSRSTHSAGAKVQKSKSYQKKVKDFKEKQKKAAKKGYSRPGGAM